MKHLLLRMLFLTGIFMLNHSFTNQSFAQCNMADWSALQALYVSTSGTTWTSSTGWNQVAPPNVSPPLGCDLSLLQGVQVNAAGRVTSLSLVNNNLVGIIPPDIGDLSSLLTLSLGRNQLSGSIPTQIGNLTNLTSLSLNDNQFSSTIPAQVWTLTGLTQLNLSDNLLTGSIPSAIGNLTNMALLNLSRNQLTGPIPVEMWTLTDMLQLSLGDNQLTGTIPSAIGNLSSLINLLLGDNLFTGPIPPEIGNLSLTNLFLDNNQFTGEIPSTFCNLTSLIQFNISNNLLVGCYEPCLTVLCNFSDSKVSTGNNFDATWSSFCMSGTGVCMPSCVPIAHVEVESADVYLDDACYGVILTSPSGMCYRLRVEDDGSIITELVTCP